RAGLPAWASRSTASRTARRSPTRTPASGAAACASATRPTSRWWRESAHDLEARGALGGRGLRAAQPLEVLSRDGLGETLGRGAEGARNLGLGARGDDRHALVAPLAHLDVDRDLREDG